MTGAVTSSRTIAVAFAESPAPFVAVHVDVVAAVSLLTVLGPQPEDVAMPDSGSETIQLMVVGPLFQPLAFGVGEINELIAGAVVSAPTMRRSAMRDGEGPEVGYPVSRNSVGVKTTRSSQNPTMSPACKLKS